MKLGIREIAFLLVLAAIPVAAWYFVFEPRNQDIEQSRQEIAKMEPSLFIAFKKIIKKIQFYSRL